MLECSYIYSFKVLLKGNVFEYAAIYQMHFWEVAGTGMWSMGMPWMIVGRFQRKT